MSDKPPIACSLHPSDLKDRASEIRALGRDGLLAIERDDDRVAMSFASDPAIRARVDAIVAAESTCCAFLSFDVRDDESAITVTVSAPEGGEPILHQLTDLFVADAEAVA